MSEINYIFLVGDEDEQDDNEYESDDGDQESDEEEEVD